ncbi:MAG TPA: sensor domain-containing diguanylate cyclase [Rhodocyclaceae bacterium]
MPTATQLMDVINIQTEIAKQGLDLGGVMSLVVERTLPLVGADGAAIELAEGDEMVYRATAGIAAPHLGLRLKRENSLSGLCVRAGETLCCGDSDSDPRVDREACRRIGLRSMIVMPLKHRGTTVGVLKAMAAQPEKFSAADVTLLGLLSELVAAAMFFATKYDSDDLFHRATHDGLTGLANRSLFMDRLRNAVSQNGRSHGAAAVLILDMDGLKQINDGRGHRIGDAVIKEFAERIKAATRLSDTAARLGGDEFGVILTPVDLPVGIEAAVARLQASIAPPFEFEGASYQLRASIGGASFPDDGSDLEHLLEVADQRMYTIKQARYRTEPRRAH